MSEALTKVQVTSLARPTSGSLLAARTAIKISEELQGVFVKARAEKWSPDALADALYIRLPEFVIETDGLWDTALYLADEFFQLGDQLLLVSKDTGLVIAKLSEDDLYTPAPVSRETEDGNTHLATSLPRLRPDLEGLLVEWQFTKGREDKLMATMAVRAKQTPLLKQEGDPRLQKVTKGGRKQIVERLNDVLPDLLQNCTGSARAFLNLCVFCTEPPDDLIPTAPCTSMAKVLMPVVDPLTFNLQHDPFTSLKSQIGTQWARDIARVLAAQVYGHGPVLEGSVFDSLPRGFWVASPNVAMALRDRRALVVPEAPSVLLRHDEGPAACILINPESFKCASREFLDRWEVAASLEFTLYIDHRKASAYEFKDVPVSGVAVEVVA